MMTVLNQKKVGKSCGLSACVRKVHGSFKDEDQYHANEGIQSSHNQDVTDSIVKNIADSGEYKNKDEISYASKKYHEYLVRQLKPVGEEEKKKKAKTSRKTQRRQRLLERRKKYAIRREVPLLQVLTEKYMSDEETDSDDEDSFIKRSLKWRSEGLNKLLAKLDERFVKSREKKDNSKPMKKQKIGPESERPPPRSAHDWAVAPSYDRDSTDHLELSPQADDIAASEVAISCSNSFTPSDDEDADMDAWICQVTGARE